MRVLTQLLTHYFLTSWVKGSSTTASTRMQR
nr:MAG TPA: hypothetical protein [Crassvirales sp.]